MQVISADIGGTHISVASVHWKDGQALVGSSYHPDINTSQTAEAIIAEWSKAIQQVSGSRSDFYLGISMPGPYDYQNGTSLIKTQGKMRSLYGLSVKNLLSPPSFGNMSLREEEDEEEEELGASKSGDVDDQKVPEVLSPVIPSSHHKQSKTSS